MDWIQTFKYLNQVDDGLQCLEDIGVPRARALAVIEKADTAGEDLEISIVIGQLGDLPEPEPPPAVAGDQVDADA